MSHRNWCWEDSHICNIAELKIKNYSNKILRIDKYFEKSCFRHLFKAHMKLQITDEHYIYVNQTSAFLAKMFLLKSYSLENEKKLIKMGHPGIIWDFPNKLTCNRSDR